jgi:tetratricopeptide (TPR) repeat protein
MLLIIFAACSNQSPDHQGPLSSGPGGPLQPGEFPDGFGGRQVVASVDHPEIQMSRDLLLKARQDCDVKKLVEAESVLKEALKKADDQAKELLYIALGDVENEKVIVNITTGDPALGPSNSEAWFKKALSLNPKSLGAQLGLAKHYDLHREFDACVKVLAEVPKQLLYQNWEDAVRFADCLSERGDREEAVQFLENALKVIKPAETGEAEWPGGGGRKSAKIEYHLGRLHAANGRPDLAKTALVGSMEATKQYGGSACSFVALGHLYVETGQLEKAAQVAKEAADIEPDNPLLLREAAETLFRAGDYENASVYVDRLIELSAEPENLELKKKINEHLQAIENAVPTLLLRQSLIQFQRNDLDAAFKSVQRAAGKTDDPRFLIVEGFVLLFKKDYDRAKRAFQRAEKSDQPKMVQAAKTGLGHLAIIRKDHQAVDSLFAAALNFGRDLYSTPIHVEALEGDFDWFVYRMACLGQAWSYSNQNRHREALEYFDTILKQQPNDILALLGRANSLTAFDDLDGAEKLLGQVLSLDPKNPYALAELAMVKLRRGDTEAAEKGFREAAKEGAKAYTCPFEGLGILYMQQGKVEQAKVNFEKAIERNPEIEFQKFNGLARIYIKEGKVAKARELLKKSIENYPYDPEAKNLLESLSP